MLGKVSLRSVALVAVCSLLCAEASAGLRGIIGNLNIGGGANPLGTVVFEGPDSIILTASNFDVVTAQVASGYNWGAWDGLGIVNLAAKNNPAFNTNVGVMRGDDYLWGTFYGVTVQPSWVLVHYTYDGDADFNGAVDFDDYGRIDAAFFNPAIPRVWANGDFNHDGDITFDDYGIIDATFFSQGTEPVQFSPGWPGPGIVGAGSGAPVPEPGTLALLLTFGAAFIATRLKRRNAG